MTMTCSRRLFRSCCFMAASGRRASLFSGQRLEEFKLAQAESAARFALRHNGQESTDRLLGATRALAAAITALVAERAERVKLEWGLE